MTEPRSDSTRALARELVEQFPSDAAVELEEATDEEALALLGGLDPAHAAPVLDRVTPVSAARLLTLLAPEPAARILESLEPARAAAMVSRLEPEVRRAILDHLRRSDAKEITALSEYPPESAGSLMDPQVMAFHPGMKVGVVLNRLRDLPNKRASEVFLVDEGGVLTGAVPLQELALARTDQVMQELVGPMPLSVQAMSSRNEVVDVLAQADKEGLVVVDAAGRLLGVIRREAQLQAAQEVATAGVQAMVGASKDERALSKPLFAVRKRLPWLTINLGTAFLAAMVVGLFESTIARFTALAVLLPVVAGQSGNTGAQALAVTMRGLALREIRVRHALVICIKELKVALLNGLAIALVTAAAVLIWSRSLGLTAVIGVSMVLSMAAAGLAGAAIPMVLTVLKQDPAQSSSIVLTTVTDVVGFFSFLGIATIFASWL